MHSNFSNDCKQWQKANKIGKIFKYLETLFDLLDLFETFIHFENFLLIYWSYQLEEYQFLIQVYYGSHIWPNKVTSFLFGQIVKNSIHKALNWANWYIYIAKSSSKSWRI